MSNFIFSQEDGSFSLGTAGYYVLAALLLLALILCAVIVDRKQKNTHFSARRLAVCGVCLALAFILSYIKFELPYGGSVTAFSMLSICLIGYFYGIKAGLLSAAAYSILQFIQSGGSYMLSPFQVCCDYFFAFTALGITGFFYKKENKLIPAYLLAIFTRGLFHTLGGYLYWMEYMPASFPKSISLLYPFVYNYSYILAEGVLTVLVLQIPAVKKTLKRLKVIATAE